MKVQILKKAVVITPTIGSNKLVAAIKSVQNQTYKNIEHLVVIDGEKFASKFFEVLRTIDNIPTNLKHTECPYNTGANGFYGHRIYAAYPHLIDADYILFLDEDNWFDSNHVESLIERLEKDDLDFSFSLRTIYDEKQNKYIEDNCESLGVYPIWFTENRSPPYTPQYLIDTSSFCFKRDFIVRTCHYWHSGWGGDRRYLALIKHTIPNLKFACSNKHTLMYRLDGNDNSVKFDFFIQGNKAQTEKYGNILPWQK